MKFLLVLLCILISCTAKNTTPEGALKLFINNRFSKQIDKANFLDYFTGPLKEKFSNLDEEEVDKFLRIDGLIKKSFKIISKSCESGNCFVTYTLSYHSDIKGGSSFDSKIKKVVELRKIENIWKIATINNVKTFHKANEAINALE